jgi:hypothetical protein
MATDEGRLRKLEEAGGVLRKKNLKIRKFRKNPNEIRLDKAKAEMIDGIIRDLGEMDKCLDEAMKFM